MGIYLGVDGCKHGWIAVFAGNNGELDCSIHPTMAAVIHAPPDAQRIFVDIPIGLPWRDCPARPCDRLARQRLGRPRASSVFPAPSRKACKAGNEEQARLDNQAVIGKSLSQQAWCICRKIAEVDDLLLCNTAARHLVSEIHPEVCFWALNGQQAMRHAKKTKQGVQERLDVLSRREPQADRLLQKALAEWPKAVIQVDDVLDALVAHLTARAPGSSLQPLRGVPGVDEKGLPMQMLHLV